MTLAEHLARLYRVTFRPHRRAYRRWLDRWTARVMEISGDPHDYHLDAIWWCRDCEQDFDIDTRAALHQNRIYAYRTARLDALWDRHLPEIKADLLRDNDALLDFSFDPIGRG